VATIARRADVHRRTVYRWINDRQLSATNVGRPGGRKRLKVSELAWRQFVASRTVPAVAPPAPTSELEAS
jgi:excisionase family DNA binding protein